MDASEFLPTVCNNELEQINRCSLSDGNRFVLETRSFWQFLGLADTCERLSIGLLAAFYYYFACALGAELDLTYHLRCLQLDQDLLRVQSSCQPERRQVVLVDDVFWIESLIERRRTFYLHYLKFKFKNEI